MKKIFLTIFAMLIACTSVFADNGKLYYNNVLNNRFGDNWTLSFGGGLNYSAWNGFGDDQGTFTDNLGWSAEVSATKWMNPIFGLRFSFDTGEYNVYDSFTSRNCWFITPHVDGMINLSNWIGGYREDRVYYANVFAGLGLNMTNVGDATDSGLAATVGLVNTFRVSNKVDINLELKSYLVSGMDMQREVSAISKKLGQVYSATVGVTFRFGKRDWDRGVPSYVASDYLVKMDMLSRDLDNESAVNSKNIKRINDYEDRIKALEAENKELADQIKDHKCNSEIIVSTSTIFFDFDSSKISKKSVASLDIFADLIKNSNNKFTIEGYADNSTGTKEYNQKLSENRAKAVYDYLVDKGVDKDCLSYVGMGESNQFDGASTNRVVLIK